MKQKILSLFRKDSFCLLPTHLYKCVNNTIVRGIFLKFSFRVCKNVST